MARPAGAAAASPADAASGITPFVRGLVVRIAELLLLLKYSTVTATAVSVELLF